MEDALDINSCTGAMGQDGKGPYLVCYKLRILEIPAVKELGILLDDFV